MDACAADDAAGDAATVGVAGFRRLGAGPPTEFGLGLLLERATFGGMKGDASALSFFACGETLLEGFFWAGEGCGGGADGVDGAGGAMAFGLPAAAGGRDFPPPPPELGFCFFWSSLRVRTTKDGPEDIVEGETLCSGAGR